MKKPKKVARAKWPVAWSSDRTGAGRVIQRGKMARLPLGIRQELNRRLQQGEAAAPLAEWLNGLPETQTALARDLGGPKVTIKNVAEWARGGFRDWQAKHDSERKIVQQFLAWAQQSQTLDMLYGPRMSYFEKRNKEREILGMQPLTRADIPPGEDWDTIPPRTHRTRQQREQAIRELLGIGPEDVEPCPAPGAPACNRLKTDNPAAASESPPAPTP